MTSEKKATHLTEAEQEEQKRFTAEVRHHPGRPGTYSIVTYGCQMNAHDSEKIAGMLEDMGMEVAENREQADFVIFNTCCIRDNAERKALGNVTWLKEIKKSRPEMMIAVCGCMVQEPGMAEKLLKQYRFVDLAFGTSNLHRLPELILKRLDSRDNLVEVDERDRIPEGLPIRRLRKEFAYLTIMYCSLCPRKGKKQKRRRYPEGSRTAGPGRRTGNYAVGAKCQQLWQGNGRRYPFPGTAEKTGRYGYSQNPVYDQPSQGPER